jgi:serine/threonine protein kinase/tetratricopeptide (TPR) repeat protein
MADAGTELLVEIVGEAMRLPPDHRDAYIEHACPGPETLHEARSLVRALESAGGFLETPTVAPGGRGRGVVIERPGDRVGPYTLLEQIGEGGFGVVFSAEQHAPVRRTVALKIIKLGMDTRAVVARFEAERQALAMMDHSNIAKVLDAGATAAGRPYFVMELVRGEPITAYCDAHALSTPERLGLFAQVCLAVQHAHTKGIIHRDLTPANILVSDVDGRPLPRVIDFGIAKATAVTAPGAPAYTEARQLIGTPEYMSPEQAGGESVDVDTRTDVYSLGAVLYELLTATTPLDGPRLRSGPWDEMLRMIRETEPPRPSTRATAAATPPLRQSPAPPSVLRGDLDWIVMRCLEKDRTRRYQTAESLASDVKRHLAGQPVLAAPPSRTYLLRKFARRHRAGVAAAAAVAVSLVAGLSAALWQAGIAARQRDTAEARRTQTEQVAEFQAAQLRDLDPQLMGALLREDLLAGVRDDPPGSEARRAQLSALLAGVNLTDVALRVLDRNVFTRAIAVADERFADQPAIRADLLLTSAQTLMELGLIDRAEAPMAAGLELRRQTLGDDDPATIRAQASAAELLLRRGRFPAAYEQLGQALARATRVLGEDDPLTITILSNRAMVRLRQGHAIEAERLFREVLEKRRRLLDQDDPRVLASTANVALALTFQGKHEQAEPFYRRAFEGFSRVRGPDHRQTIRAMTALAISLERRGEHDRADALLHQSLAKLRARLGDEHPETLNCAFQLAQVLLNRGRREDLPEAEALTLQALEGRRRALGDAHTETLDSLDQLGWLRVAQGRLPEAESVFRGLIETQEKRGAGASPRALQSRLCLGKVLTGLQRFPEAETEVLAVSRTLATSHGGGVLDGCPRAANACAPELVDLYTAWAAAEPGKGYEARAAHWQALMERDRAATARTGPAH